MSKRESRGARSLPPPCHPGIDTTSLALKLSRRCLCASPTTCLVSSMLLLLLSLALAPRTSHSADQASERASEFLFLPWHSCQQLPAEIASRVVAEHHATHSLGPRHDTTHKLESKWLPRANNTWTSSGYMHHLFSAAPPVLDRTHTLTHLASKPMNRSMNRLVDLLSLA